MAVAEPDRFVNISGLGDFKRRRPGDIEHFNIVGFDFDLPGREFWICRSLRALANDTGDAEYVFAANITGCCMSRA